MPIRVKLEHLDEPRNFIYMTGKSVEYNVQAFLTSIQNELTLDKGARFIYTVNGVDLSTMEQTVSALIKPGQLVDLQRVTEDQDTSTPSFDPLPVKSCLKRCAPFREKKSVKWNEKIMVKPIKALEWDSGEEIY